MITKTPGCMRYRINKYWRQRAAEIVFFLLCFSVIGILSFSGCASSEKTKEKESLDDFLAKSEKNFNPSDYDKDVKTVIQEASGKPIPGKDSAKTVAVISDTVTGYRVQVLFTQDIEAANGARDTLQALLPDEYIYIVYEPPYYKVRVGNYTDRVTANDMQKKIIAKGYTDAWVVPDKVIINLPPIRQTPPGDQKQN
ncbi:MAG: SPOR domain-containing protein [Bacteroidota bacterium]